MPNPIESAGETREGQRIAKVMARAGLCSRRDAEQWIGQGRVSVNGEVLTSPAYNVSDADDIQVDGAPLRSPERTRLFLFHKPRGLVTTAKDPEGRSTIFDALPQDLPRVVAVGRLDINTEGLLLLTNDGGLSRILELPLTGWLRRYRVRAHGEITQAQLDGLRDGVTIDGVDYLGIEARFERQQGSNVWLTMGLREGKNREIKRVLEHMGLSVNRLIRVSFGPFELGDLAEGELVEVRTRVLRDQLGPKLAKAAGANFEAPLEAPAPSEPASRGDRPPRRHEPPTQRETEVLPRGARRETVDPRKRKHVSVLRAEARQETTGPRKRISRATTADRKGREVKIERVSLVRSPDEAARERPEAHDGFGPRKRQARPPKREEFAARGPREDGRPPRRSGEGFAGGPREEGRPPRREGAAPHRGGEGFPRGPREEGRPPRREGSAPRGGGEGFARGPREEGRPPRREGSAPRGGEGFARGPREEGRPPRREGSAPRGGGEGFARGPREEGGPPRREGSAPRGGGEGFARGPREEGRPPRREGSGPRHAGGGGFARGPREEGRPPRREGSGPRRAGGGGFATRPPRDDRGGPPRGPRPGGGGKKPRGK